MLELHIMSTKIFGLFVWVHSCPPSQLCGWQQCYKPWTQTSSSGDTRVRTKMCKHHPRDTPIERPAGLREWKPAQHYSLEKGTWKHKEIPQYTSLNVHSKIRLKIPVDGMDKENLEPHTSTAETQLIHPLQKTVW